MRETQDPVGGEGKMLINYLMLRNDISASAVIIGRLSGALKQSSGSRRVRQDSPSFTISISSSINSNCPGDMKTAGGETDGALYLRQLVGAAHASGSQGVGETRKDIKPHELTCFDAPATDLRATRRRSPTRLCSNGRICGIAAAI